MRFMLMVKATGHSEARVQDSREYSDAKLAYKQLLAESGALLAAEALQPSASGIRISYSAAGELPAVQAGPFPAGQELLAEYILFEAQGEAEAVDWALRMPIPAGLGEFELELRRLEEEGAAHWRNVGARGLEADLHNQLVMLRRA